ncbi:MAG TPA: hypothetical protein VK886_14675 [Vicinamibacterales bacterium]|nr:hypothetical protein [Vicinamibacterales bacterium]
MGTWLAAFTGAMDIRFVSTLTPDDEDHLAPVLLTAVTALLDHSELAYTLRIKTSSEAVFHHSHPAVASAPAAREPDDRAVYVGRGAPADC